MVNIWQNGKVKKIGGDKMLTEQEHRRLNKLVKMLANGLVWQKAVILNEIQALLKKAKVKREL